MIAYQHTCNSQPSAGPLETTLPMNPSDGKCLINQSDEINSSCIINNLSGTLLHTLRENPQSIRLPISSSASAPKATLVLWTHTIYTFPFCICHKENTVMVKLSQQLKEFPASFIVGCLSHGLHAHDLPTIFQLIV